MRCGLYDVSSRVRTNRSALAITAAWSKVSGSGSATPSQYTDALRALGNPPAPWSWTNYWPNFLEGMGHVQHAWKANNAPNRIDGSNGWGSPIVRFVQRGLHPYLLVDHEILRTNPPRKRDVGDGQIEWPYRVPRCVAGDAIDVDGG